MMNNTVYLQRDFACSADKLYQWLTQPQLIAQWFGPEQLSVAHVSNSIVVGGQYSIELLKPNGTVFFIEGSYLKLEKPSLIEFTLHYRGQASTPPESVVTMRIQAITQESARLKLKQIFELEPADMSSRTKGWEYMLSMLDSLVAAS